MGFERVLDRILSLIRRNLVGYLARITSNLVHEQKRQETDLRSVCFTVRMRYECAVVRLSPHLGQLIFSKTYCLYKSIYIY